MRIRMYNVGFGDCFCLRNKNENLLVDFGTSNHRINGQRRRDVFDLIIADLSTFSRKNLLLTNFHPDHLSGLLYLLRHRERSYEFEKIYFPDVFSKKEYSRTLALLLLSDLLKDSWLPSHQVSLYALAEALRRKPRQIDLLSRGKAFEKDYVALWPDMDVVSQETERILAELWPEHSWILEKLIAYADKLRLLILGMTEEKLEKDAQGSPVGLTDLEEEFRDLRQTAEFRHLMEYAEKTDLNLRGLKHRISIVFQNQTENDQNLLFTGDVPSEYLELIARNYDDSIPLQTHYWSVKVPHHGTASHYFDFSAYTPENLLISSGIYYTTGRKQAKTARISPQYAGLFHTWEVTVWCSDPECCDGYQDGCSCKDCEIIAPRYYLDIR